MSRSILLSVAWKCLVNQSLSGNSRMISLQLSKVVIILSTLSIFRVLTTAIPLDASSTHSQTSQLLRKSHVEEPIDHLDVGGRSLSHLQYRSDPPLTLTPPTSLSHPEPNSLSPRSLESMKGWTYRVLQTNVIQPVTKTAVEVFKDIDSTLNKWVAYADALDAMAPSSHFVLRYGDLRMEFWSPAPIAWTAVSGILKLYLLLGMMLYTFMTWTFWQYVGLAAVTVLFNVAAEGRGDRIIPVK